MNSSAMLASFAVVVASLDQSSGLGIKPSQARRLSAGQRRLLPWVRQKLTSYPGYSMIGGIKSPRHPDAAILSGTGARRPDGKPVSKWQNTRGIIGGSPDL